MGASDEAAFGLSDLEAGRAALAEAEQRWRDARDALAELLKAQSDGLSYETIGLLIVTARDARTLLASIEGHLAYLDAGWEEVCRLIAGRNAAAVS